MTADEQETPHFIEMTRRDWLTLAGVSATASLAGCGGDSQQIQQQTPVESSDAEFLTTEFNTVHNNNYNFFDTLFYPIQSPWYIYGQLYNASLPEGDYQGEILPCLGEMPGPWEQDQSGDWDLNVEGDEVIVPLSDEYTWHDGDPVIADDIVTLYKLLGLMEYPVWNLLENVEAIDDYAVRFETVPDVNSEILADRLAVNDIATKRDIFEQFVPDEPVEEMSAGQRTRIRGELLNLTLREPGEVIGWGPWQMHERREREMIFTLYEDHPRADDINFERVKFEWFSTKQARAQNLVSGNFDGFDEVPNELMNREVPDYYQQYEYPRRTGWGWGFNYDHPYFQHREVRQAFAYALDKRQIVANSGQAEVARRPHTRDTAFFGTEDDHYEYFGDDIFDVLTTYDQDQERAAELLESVGWQRDDGQWYDENGEPVSVTIVVALMWPEQVNMAETSVDQLQDFGIDANFETQELAVYYAGTMIDADYDIASWITGAARTNPYNPLTYMWDGSEVTTDEHNHPDVVEVPMPIGDPDGDLEEVDVREIIETLPTTPTEEQQELYRKFVWTYNQWMPVYCLNEERGVSYLDTRTFQGPEPDEDVARSWVPINYMMNQGHIYAVK